jgi:hypothetical protein
MFFLTVMYFYSVEVKDQQGVCEIRSELPSSSTSVFTGVRRILLLSERTFSLYVLSVFILNLMLFSYICLNYRSIYTVYRILLCRLSSGSNHWRYDIQRASAAALSSVVKDFCFL